jgi:serine protease DegQ
MADLSSHVRTQPRTLLVLLLGAVLAIGACADEDPTLTPGIGETPGEPAPIDSPEAPTPDSDETGQAPGGQTPGDPAPGEEPDIAAPFMTADLPDLIEAVEPSVVAIQRGGGGEGSGVIWGADGIIVSNHHVVVDAAGLEVVFTDGTRAEATVVASDPRVDLAVLRVDRSDLPVAEFRDDLPRVGELAVAIGNPLGFQGSATLGIISGVGRAVPGSARVSPALVDLIQTDAPISPGNSGGALVGADGRVIGINVAYIPPAGGAVSIGFAIPAATVVDVVTQLLENGTVQHAYLGVEPATLRPGMAPGTDLGTDRGAIVMNIVPGGPASQVGMEAGDVIVGFAGEAIGSAEELLGAIRRAAPGDTVEVTFLRGGAEQTIDVTLGELPNG